MKCSFLVGAAVAVVCGCSTPVEESGSSQAAIVGGVDASDYPEAVLVDMSGGGACGGVLVAPRVVLTAGHCINGFSSWNVRTEAGGARITGRGNAATSQRITGRRQNDGLHDVGVVVLDEPISLPCDEYPARGTLDGPRVVTVGRSVRGQAVDAFTASRSLNASATSTDYISTGSDAVGEFGDSGGPVFQAGTHKLVGVNSSSSPGQITFFARVDAVDSWIQGLIDQNGGACSAAPQDPAPQDPLAAPQDPPAADSRAH